MNKIATVSFAVLMLGSSAALAQPNGYGPYGQPNEPNGYGPYGQPNEPNGYGPYGQPNEPSGYGPYGQPNEPSGYGPYGQPSDLYPVRSAHRLRTQSGKDRQLHHRPGDGAAYHASGVSGTLPVDQRKHVDLRLRKQPMDRPYSSTEGRRATILPTSAKPRAGSRTGPPMIRKNESRHTARRIS